DYDNYSTTCPSALHDEPKMTTFCMWVLIFAIIFCIATVLLISCYCCKCKQLRSRDERPPVPPRTSPIVPNTFTVTPNEPLIDDYGYIVLT
ncbi:hypothetical protein SK128_005865, partial [Halocaridina rubra]